MKLVKFSVTFSYIRVTHRATYCHSMPIPDRIRPTALYCKIAFSSGKIAFHTKLLQNCFRQNCFNYIRETSNRILFKYSLYTNCSKNMKLLICPYFLSFQKIKYNNRISVGVDEQLHFLNGLESCFIRYGISH